jgi:predicted PurR-regulated permease PerM
MNVEELATSVLSYALWPLLTLAIVGLWVAATMDIVRNRHGEAFTSVKLLCMATLVSVVAVIAIVGVGAVFGDQWSEAVSSAPSDGTRTNGQEMDPARAYLFSFGLEHASYSSPADPRNVASPTSQ